jgi:hypothetical protein
MEVMAVFSRFVFELFSSPPHSFVSLIPTQCADLTLSSTFSIPSNVSCSNATSTATSATSTSTGKNGASGISTSGFAGALGFLVALVTA